jgi:transposase InsO family protein
VASGKIAAEIARDYGIPETTISGWKRKEREDNSAVTTAAPGLAKAAETPPRQTGRYSMTFKEEVLAQVASGRKVIEVARQYTLPEKTIHRWKREAKAQGGDLPDPKSTRPETSRSPISAEHRSLVLSLKDKRPNMGVAQIQNHLKRFYALKLGRHMIARIFTEAGIPLEKRTPSARKPEENRFEMTRPNELWAVDFKEFWIHSEKAYALFVLDDFSRFCVGFALAENPTADLAIDTVERAIQRYGRPERMLSDRGPQFHAWNGISRFDEFLGDFLTDHTVTKAGHPFTNGKLEAFNRTIEAEVLDVEEFAALKEAEEGIRRYLRTYNFLRTHMAIDGLTPADRYFGMVEEARRALEEGLKASGPALSWLGELVAEDGVARRQPLVLQLRLQGGKLELVVLGRRFLIG